MKKAAIAAVIVLIALAVIFMRHKTPGVETAPLKGATPSSGQTRADISALGKIEPKGGVIRVGAPQEAGNPVIQHLYAKEGDRVRKGQVIAVLKSHERLQANLEEARKRLETAKVKLEIMKSRLGSPDIAAKNSTVEKLRIELAYAEKDYNRMRQLHAKKLIAQMAFDRYCADQEVKMQELNRDKSELENMHVDRRRNVELAAAELEEARAAILRAEAEYNLARVTAPLDGVVLKVYAHSGEAVDLKKGIVDLGNTDQMYVSAEVYSTDVPRLKIGQKATVRIERSDIRLTGVVEEIGLLVRKNEVIAADPASELDERVVEVKVRLDESRQVSGLTNMNVTCIIHP